MTSDPQFQLLTECTIALVDVKIVTFVKIIGDIDIWTAIQVDIGNSCTEGETDLILIQSSYGGDIFKTGSDVSIKLGLSIG